MTEPVLSLAAQKYGLLPQDLKPLSGGHFSQVFEFIHANGNPCVLRILPPDNEVDLTSMQAVLSWIEFAGAWGAPVAAPLHSTGGRLVELLNLEEKAYILVAFEKAVGVLAEELPFEKWDETLFAGLGAAVGKLHAASHNYRPPADEQPRPQWDQFPNCFNADEELDISQGIVRQQQERIRKKVHNLRRDPNGYGLIHADLHLGNFYIEPNQGTITFFDFDDCCYGWYVMDIAMLLFDFLVAYPEPQQQDFACRYLEAFMPAYLSEYALNVNWLLTMPDILKLLEISVYIQSYRYYDPADPDPWLGRFMPERQQRIEQGIPHVKLDFEGLARSLV